MNLHNLLYNNFSTETPERGCLLVSDPMMEDTCFSRSVVMILDRDSSKGHLGLILNKPTRLKFEDLMPGWKPGAEIPIYFGGPVDLERLFLLHTLGDIIPGATQVSPGIFVGGDVEQILQYMEDGEDTEGRLRFFLGYSGWSYGQLEGEISRHSWAVGRPGNSRELLTGSENDYWRREVKRLGESYRSWLVVPQDPMSN